MSHVCGQHKGEGGGVAGADGGWGLGAKARGTPARRPARHEAFALNLSRGLVRDVRNGTRVSHHGKAGPAGVPRAKDLRLAPPCLRVRRFRRLPAKPATRTDGCAPCGVHPAPAARRFIEERRPGAAAWTVWRARHRYPRRPAIALRLAVLNDRDPPLRMRRSGAKDKRDGEGGDKIFGQGNEKLN